MLEKTIKLLNQIGINEDYMIYFENCYVEQIDYGNYFKPITTFHGNFTTNSTEDSLQLKADR